MSTAQARLRTVEIDAAHRFHLRGTAIMTFIIYWLMVFTFQDFFLFNPAEGNGLFREVTLWLALGGWLVAAIGSPIALLLVSQGSLRALNFLPFTALLWPVSVVLAQISAYADTGESYLGYLFDYPVFVVTDIALPAFILVKWSRMRETLARAEIAMS
jgi:hypothetical protein